jgi:hypothetical protein
MIEIAFYLCALYELGSDAATGWYSQETRPADSYETILST